VAVHPHQLDHLSEREDPMNQDVSGSGKVIDMHCHVGLLGDQVQGWGRMSDWYRQQMVYRVFLFYGRIDPDEVSDHTLREATEEAICGSTVDHVVCLALDHVYDQGGHRREDLTPMWVHNDYVLDLCRTVGDKVLLGASVHPYDLNFRDRVRKYVEQGAVLLKWLPSAQRIDLADDRVQEALVFLSKARDGGPLPLLLHVGPEYAIPSPDPRTWSYDFLSWSWWDRARNSLRISEKWHRPQMRKIDENLRGGLREGAVIVFAHCGLPYYAPSWLAKVVEHSDFGTVSRYLRDFPADGSAGGRCYADVSAFVTPFRTGYFDAVRDLPRQSLLFGSDFPTPVFELSADAGEMWEDFQAVLRGELDRIIVPEGSLIEANYQELRKIFRGHPMFTNFGALL